MLDRYEEGPLDHHLVQELALYDLPDVRVQDGSQHPVLSDSGGYSHRLPSEILQPEPKNNTCVPVSHLSNLGVNV